MVNKMKLQENPSYVALREKLESEKVSNKDLLHLLAELNLAMVEKFDTLNGNVAIAYKKAIEACERLDLIDNEKEIAERVARELTKQKDNEKKDQYNKSIKFWIKVIGISGTVVTIVIAIVVSILKALELL
jgi:hypothetical protein